jgi:hypothetical protein
MAKNLFWDCSFNKVYLELDNPSVGQEIPAFCGTQRFITVFTRAHILNQLNTSHILILYLLTRLNITYFLCPRLPHSVSPSTSSIIRVESYLIVVFMHGRYER